MARFTTRLGCLALFGIFLGGCNTTLIGNGLDTLPADRFSLPQAGDIFVYSTGTYEVVTETHDASFDSENNRGTRYTRDANPLFNPLFWRNGERFGENSFYADDSDGAWPTSFSNIYQYFSSSDASVREIQSSWRCAADSPSNETFLIGDYPTHSIQCIQSSSSGQRPWRNVVSEYSPDLQRILRVTRETYRTRETRTTELIAIVPSPLRFDSDTGEAVSRLVQNTLENDASGTTRSVPGGTLAVTITVLGTTQSEEGIFCRNYVLMVEEAGSMESFPGLRCRSEQRVWVVPGLE